MVHDRSLFSCWAIRANRREKKGRTYIQLYCMMAGNARQPLFHFGLGLAGSDQSVERHYANHLILYKDLTIVFINS